MGPPFSARNNKVVREKTRYFFGNVLIATISVLNNYISTEFRFDLVSISFSIVLAVFSFSKLLYFADFGTWLMKLKLNLALKLQFKSLKISFVSS